MKLTDLRFASVLHVTQKMVLRIDFRSKITNSVKNNFNITNLAISATTFGIDFNHIDITLNEAKRKSRRGQTVKIPIPSILKHFLGKVTSNLHYRVYDLDNWQSFFYLDVLRWATIGFTRILKYPV